MIISTGTRATLEAIPGLAEAGPLTHVEALDLDRVPEHLLVIGGGYVGIELSQAMRRFGSKVTLIDRNQRLMSKEDEDVCEALRTLLHDEGVDILLSTRVKELSGKSGDAVSITMDQNGTEKTLKGSHVLVAAGRTPNTEGLGLDLAGVELTNRGYIKVNERLQTTAPGVSAIGEVAGSPQFTHISVDDFRVVHANLTGGNRVTTGRQVPYCLFTDPELARVGLNEMEAKARSIAYRLFKVPMEANLRARTLSETRGFLKALVEIDSDRILGFTAFGVGAGEIMSAVHQCRRPTMLSMRRRHSIKSGRHAYNPREPLRHPHNGRTLTDDVVDVFLSMCTNGKVTGDKVGPHSNLLDGFPYLGPPHGFTPKGMKENL